MFPSESEEDVNIETKIATKLEPVSDDDDENDGTTTQSKSLFIQVDENDQSSEEKQNVVEALKLTPQLEEVDNQNMKDDSDDNEENIASIVNEDYRRVLRDDDEDEN